MPYLDNAATSWPKPEQVYRAVDSFMRETAANPGRSGHRMASAAALVIEETRLLLAGLFNVSDHQRIIFTFNCTDSLNMALKGLLKSGDHVLVDAMSHNSLVRPLNKAAREGVEVTYIPPDPEHGFITAASLAREVRQNTRAVAITHASNVHGVVQPLDECGSFAREHGLVFLVDAAQTAGTLPIDVQKVPIDLLAFPGHKSLLGPMGTGGLFIGPAVTLGSFREGGTGFSSEDEEQPYELPYRFESGTANAPGIAGLGAGVKHLLEHGMEVMGQQEAELTQRLIAGLREIRGATVYHAVDKTSQAPVVSFNLEGWDPGELGVTLDQAFDIQVRSGLHCAPSTHKVLGTFPKGAVRISVGCFNTEEDIDFTLNSIEQVVSTAAVSARRYRNNKRMRETWKK
jgi:cysteine desulfurase family protein